METKKDTILGMNKSLVYFILILSLIFMARAYVEETKIKKASYLIEEYRFSEAMGYYNKVKVKGEEEALKRMYQESDYNEEIYEYIIEKGYKERDQFFHYASSGNASEREDGIWEDEIALNLEKYRSMDVDNLNLFKKLNIMVRIDSEDEFFTRLEASLDRDLENIKPSKLKYINYDMESLDHEFLLKEMKDKGIKSYFWSYIGDYKNCKYLVIGSTAENESYIYTVDNKHQMKLLDKVTGIKADYGFEYLKGFLLPEEIILSEFYDKGKRILLGFTVLDKELEIVRWDLDDDIEVKDGKIVSEKFNKSIAIKGEKIHVDMRAMSRGKLLKIFNVYNEKNRIESIVVGEYKMLRSGELEFSDFYLAI